MGLEERPHVEFNISADAEDRGVDEYDPKDTEHPAKFMGDWADNEYAEREEALVEADEAHAKELIETQAAAEKALQEEKQRQARERATSQARVAYESTLKDLGITGDELKIRMTAYDEAVSLDNPELD